MWDHAKAGCEMANIEGAKKVSHKDKYPSLGLLEEIKPLYTEEERKTKNIFLRIIHHPGFWGYNIIFAFWVVVASLVISTLQMPRDFQNNIFPKIEELGRKQEDTRKEILDLLEETYTKKEVIYSMLEGEHKMRNDKNYESENKKHYPRR